MKYRKAVITSDVEEKLKEICEQISLHYEIEFLEIGTDNEHVHFLVQSVPMYSPTKIVRTIKSITAKEIFRQMPEAKKQLWDGEFWSDGYYISTVGADSSENESSC
jgi:REP element-mobilizing transposase RayT